MEINKVVYYYYQVIVYNLQNHLIETIADIVWIFFSFKYFFGIIKGGDSAESTSTLVIAFVAIVVRLFMAIKVDAKRHQKLRDELNRLESATTPGMTADGQPCQAIHYRLFDEPMWDVVTLLLGNGYRVIAACQGGGFQYGHIKELPTITIATETREELPKVVNGITELLTTNGYFGFTSMCGTMIPHPGLMENNKAYRESVVKPNYVDIIWHIDPHKITET